MTHRIASTYEHVPAGTVLSIQETDASGWSLVTHADKPVWVPAAWLKPVGDEAPLPPPPAPAAGLDLPPPPAAADGEPPEDLPPPPSPTPARAVLPAGGGEDVMPPPPPAGANVPVPHVGMLHRKSLSNPSLPPPPPPPPAAEDEDDDVVLMVPQAPGPVPMSAAPAPEPAVEPAPVEPAASPQKIIVVDGAEAFYVRALYDFEPQDADELKFRAGQLFKVLHAQSQSDWWFGDCDGRLGHFPADYVKRTDDVPMSQADIDALQRAVMEGNSAASSTAGQGADDSDDDDDDDEDEARQQFGLQPAVAGTGSSPMLFAVPPPPPPEPVDLDADQPPSMPPPSVPSDLAPAPAAAPPAAEQAAPATKPKPKALPKTDLTSKLEGMVGGMGPPGSRPSPFGLRAPPVARGASMPSHLTPASTGDSAAALAPASNSPSGRGIERAATMGALQADGGAPRRKAPPPPPGVQPIRRSGKKKRRPPPPGTQQLASPSPASPGSPAAPGSASPAQARSQTVSTPGAVLPPSAGVSSPHGQQVKPPRPEPPRQALTASEQRAQERVEHDVEFLRGALRSWKSTDGSPSTFNLFRAGQLMKISKGKHQCRNFFLFDNLLVYAKREKGRLDVRGKLPTCDVIVKDVTDGRLKHGSNPIRNAFEISNLSKSKWYVLYATTFEEKRKWMQALESERTGTGALHQSMTVTLTRAPGRGFGFEMAEVTPGRSEGARVSMVTFPELCPGVQHADILWQVNGIGVHRLSLDEVIRLLYMTPEGGTLQVELKRR